MKRTSSAVIAFIVLVLVLLPAFPAYATELRENPNTAYSAEISGNDPGELTQTSPSVSGIWVLESMVPHGESTKSVLTLEQPVVFDTVGSSTVMGWKFTQPANNYQVPVNLSISNPPERIASGEALSLDLSLYANRASYACAWAGIAGCGMEQYDFEQTALLDREFGAWPNYGYLPTLSMETEDGYNVISVFNPSHGSEKFVENTDRSETFTVVMPDSSVFGSRCSVYVGITPEVLVGGDPVITPMAEFVYAWQSNEPLSPSGSEDIPGSIKDYDEGLSPVAIGGITVVSLVVLIGIIAAIVKAAAAKAAAAEAATAVAAAQAAVVPETVSYQPEVYDWRGNRIDENARVRQTEQEYVQANRETQAQLDAERESIRLAEEAALQKEIAEHNAYVERLSEKYFGTASSSERTKAEMANRILENREREETLQKYIGRYQRYSHGLETLTGLVESGSDIFIDVGGDLGGPVGKGIRVGYKVIKPAIKNFCERGSTMRSVLSAAIKGAGDAASDFLPADGKGKELAKQMAKKAGVQFTGELPGELIDEGGSVTRAVYNTAVKTVINTAKDEIGGSRFISGSATKLRESGKRYLLSTSGTLAENSLSMKGAK